MLQVGYAGGTTRAAISVSFGLDTDGQPDSYIYRGGSLNSDFRQQIWSERNENNDGIGYNYLQGIEYGANSVTWLGNPDARVQSGIQGWLDG